MTVADMVRIHQKRCARHLARLRCFARGEAIPAAGPSAARLVTEATSTILAEAKAAGRAALAPGDGGSGGSSLLGTRLARLEKSAYEAVAAARDGNPVVLRQELTRFETFMSAMWTVQLAIGSQGP